MITAIMTKVVITLLTIAPNLSPLKVQSFEPPPSPLGHGFIVSAKAGAAEMRLASAAEVIAVIFFISIYLY